MQPTIYLFFKGNCLEAMTHYADILGGQITGVFRNGDAEPEHRMKGGDDLILNMAMTLGSATIMASDNSDDMYDRPQGFFVSIDAKDEADFDRIYAAMTKDAEAIIMAPAEMFWADKFSMFRDGFGIPWMLSYVGSKEQAHG